MNTESIAGTDSGETNPYAPPKAPVWDRHNSMQGICREQKRLRVIPGSVLPDICYRCGEESRGIRINHTVYYLNWFFALIVWLVVLFPVIIGQAAFYGGITAKVVLILMIIFNPVTAMFAAFFLQRKGRLKISVCDHCNGRRRSASSIGALALLGGFLLPVILPDDWLSIYQVTGMIITGISIYAVCRYYTRLPRAMRIDSQGILLKGFNTAFLNQIPRCDEITNNVEIT